MTKQLVSYIGLGGHTSDEAFAEVLDALDEQAIYFDTQEEECATADIITLLYRCKDTETVYELWYQVRTVDSPEEMEYAFGFDRAS